MEMEEREGREGGEDEGRKVTRSDREGGERDRDGGKAGEKDERSRGCC